MSSFSEVNFFSRCFTRDLATLPQANGMTVRTTPKKGKMVLTGLFTATTAFSLSFATHWHLPKKDEEVDCVQVCIFSSLDKLGENRIFSYELIRFISILMSYWSNPLCNINNTKKTHRWLCWPSFFQSSVAPTIIFRGWNHFQRQLSGLFSIPFWQNPNAPRIKSVRRRLSLHLLLRLFPFLTLPPVGREYNSLLKPWTSSSWFRNMKLKRSVITFGAPNVSKSNWFPTKINKFSAWFGKLPICATHI